MSPPNSHPSAQPDHFVHDRLPTPEALPTFHYDRPELQIADQANLVQALFDQAEHAGHGDRPLLRGPHGIVTYRQARTHAARIAQVLTEDHGLVPGNRVLLRGGNTVEMALAWLGVVYAGLDIGQAISPLIFGVLMDHGQFQGVLIGLAVVQAVLIASAFNVRRVRRTALVPA